MAQKIPKTEVRWVDITDTHGEHYTITSKENDRSFFFLYHKEENGWVKLGKGRSPLELERKYVQYEEEED